MAQKVSEHQAHVGLAFDGDGDRLVVCDELGQIVDGDQLLGIFALDALKTDRLEKRVFISTIQSNLGLDQAIARSGGGPSVYKLAIEMWRTKCGNLA